MPIDAGWSLADAAELYQIGNWGGGYFDINDRGHVVVQPHGPSGPGIDLHEVVEGLAGRDLHAPVLLRFSDILDHRLQRIADAFGHAIAENEYRGTYRAVYPIKVNQQRPVVEEIASRGRRFGFGLEVGSKPELLAVMALTESEPDRVIVCNGFKDDAFIQAVILATKLGRTIVPVVESFVELKRIISHARRHDVRPMIGVRVKLSSQGAGRWKGSAGAKSKFGLFVHEVLEMVETLEAEDMLDCLKLVHCHPGSQLHDIRRIKEAVGELAHVYAELVGLGAGLEYIDVGGGLGVDYDGSQTNFASSMNYTLEEYASEVVYRIANVCNEKGVEHPTIISESGRAIAAFQSILVFNVLGRTMLPHQSIPESAGDLPEGTPQPIRDLFEACENISPRRLVECYHDAIQAREQAMHLFGLGYLSLELRGLAERLFWSTCGRARALARDMPEMPEELEHLETILCETYFCNFSVFQSLPDAWAIDQLFPIMPIHRLREEPTVKAVLADITCDSDGRIDRFVDRREIARTIDLHAPTEGRPYYLAAFLVGAYQETLGDLHNLFGDTHVVHIRLHEQGGWWIDEVVRGDTAAEVLGYVQYDVEQLKPRLARDCEQALRDGRMTLEDRQALLRFYESELSGYTYLAPDQPAGGESG